MKTSDELDHIDLLIRTTVVRHLRYTRDDLLAMMNAELSELSSKMDADFFLVHLDPIIETSEGERWYNLPDAFPANFAPASTGYDREHYACKISDGNNEVALEWKSPAQFFAMDLTSESNGKPTIYTIMSVSDSRRQIGLSPPPDTNSGSQYTIMGLYKPTDWELEDLDELPPLPENASVLRYAVLRNFDRAQYEPFYREALGDLRLEVARARGSKMVPVIGPYERARR